MKASFIIKGIIKIKDNEKLLKMIALKEQCDELETDYPVDMRAYFVLKGIELDDVNGDEITTDFCGRLVESETALGRTTRINLKDLPGEVEFIEVSLCY